MRFGTMQQVIDTAMVGGEPDPSERPLLRRDDTDGWYVPAFKVASTMLTGSADPTFVPLTPGSRGDRDDGSDGVAARPYRPVAPRSGGVWKPVPTPDLPPIAAWAPRAAREDVLSRR